MDPFSLSFCLSQVFGKVYENNTRYPVLVMLWSAMVELFVIQGLVWCIKGTSVFNHAYPCINISYIANTMICYVVLSL